jgi:hypothetical protein
MILLKKPIFHLRPSAVKNHLNLLLELGCISLPTPALTQISRLINRTRFFEYLGESQLIKTQYLLAMGILQPVPKARSVILMPGGACRRLNSAFLTN